MIKILNTLIVIALVLTVVSCAEEEKTYPEVDEYAKRLQGLDIQVCSEEMVKEVKAFNDKYKEQNEERSI